MEEKNRLSEIMDVTMSKIREMIDANTVVGDPLQTPDGITIIPVSKISIGFASGGSDYVSKHQNSGKNPFGGGGGAGVKIEPVAFLVVNKDKVRLLPVAQPPTSTVERVVEMVPDVVDKVTDMVEKRREGKKADEEAF